MVENGTSMGQPMGSSERFGYEWSRYNEIRSDYETQFRRWTPFLQPVDWRDKRVLDVGCGTGRNSLWPLSYGAAEAVAIDVDERSLEVARQNLATFPNALVLKQSAYDIGFEDNFDIAFSIGVIHHLEDPMLALRQMVKAAKPGGKVLIWVYGYENNEWIVRFADPLRKLLFARLPIGVVHHLSLYPTAVLWTLLRAGFGRIAYFQLLKTFSFRHIRSIVFDQMLPRIAHYWDRGTVQRMMDEVGLKNVRLEWVNEISWAAIGEKGG
ncbi:MAG: class I SAM-dependent methyltransferase [Bradyrhizobium sp.]|nr:class I SAM-dependent methyltransferase [Bradyrhizobium sp.]